MTPERIARLVSRWVRFYTREVATPLAQRRIGEIDADLYDQIAHERAHGASDPRIALSILSRMVRGLPADVSWRARHARSTTDPAYRSVIRVVLVAAFIWLLPFLALQFDWLVPDPGSSSPERVGWSMFDFAFAGVMLVGTGLLFQLAARKAPDIEYRAAVILALAAAFFLIWVTGAVGIIGSEDNDANLMYFGVVAVAIIGAISARFRPQGLALAMLATALVQVSVFFVALIGGSGEDGPISVVGLTGFFAALWLASAWLFRRAARQLAAPGAEPQG